MASLIIVNLELRGIKFFLDTMLRAVDVDYARIFKRDDAGVFRCQDDLANALFPAKQTEAITIRAVFNEICSLIEWMIRTAVPRPIEAGRRPLDPFRENLSNVKKRLEMRIGTSLADLQGWAALERVREQNNAFKHRKGFVDFIKHPGKPIPTKHDVPRKDAYDAIEAARNFLTDLKDKLRR